MVYVGHVLPIAGAYFTEMALIFYRNGSAVLQLSGSLNSALCVCVVLVESLAHGVAVWSSVMPPLIGAVSSYVGSRVKMVPHWGRCMTFLMTPH